MGEISEPIAHTDDDVRVRDDGSNFNANVFDLRQGLRSGEMWLLGVRFRDISIPQGANIISASVDFTRIQSGSGDPGRLYGQAADDAPIWDSSGVRPDNMPRTTAFLDLPGNDESFGGVDVTNIVQEIVDRGGWQSGNALAFGGGSTGATDYISPWTAASAPLTPPCSMLSGMKANLESQGLPTFISARPASRRCISGRPRSRRRIWEASS